MTISLRFAEKASIFKMIQRIDGIKLFFAKNAGDRLLKHSIIGSISFKSSRLAECII